MQCGKSLECRAVASALDAIVMALMVEYFSIPPPFGLGSVSGRDYSMDEIVLHAVVPFTGLYGYKYAGFPGLRALVFFEVMAIDTLMFSKRPWSLRGSRRHAPMGADGWVCSLLYAVHQMLSLGPCTVAVHGAPGHSRWEVVETPVPVKTQGR